MGNESDKASRIPGMKEMIADGKQFSGQKLEMQTIRWKFDEDETEEGLRSCFDQIKVTETQPDPILHCLLKTAVPVPCNATYSTRSVTLFNKPHIIHAFNGDRADKICIHKADGSVEKVISVPDIKNCGDSVVVDASTIVVADHVQELTEKDTQGKSKTHLSGSLHWLALTNDYNVIKHARVRLQCIQHGYMNVTFAGHVLVLTHCTTRTHSKQLVVYDKNRCVIYAMDMSSKRMLPMSAVSSDRETFVVMDGYKRRAIWIDK